MMIVMLGKNTANTTKLVVTHLEDTIRTQNHTETTDIKSTWIIA